MAVPLSPRGHMPDDGYNSNIGRGSDCCMKCNHPMGFHSSSQNDMSVKCHLDGCSCNVTYEEAMDRAAEIRGDLDQMKYRAQEKMKRLQKEADERMASMPKYVRASDPPYQDSRFLALQAELAETRRRYESLMEQATRRAEMEVRPIIIHRTIDGGVVPQDFGIARPGQIWIENEDVYIGEQEGQTKYGVEKPKSKSKAVKPEPPHRRVVKLPGKRGQ